MSSQKSTRQPRLQPVPEPAPVYTNLRKTILGLAPGGAGIIPLPDAPNVWGVLMEMGYEEAAVTLVSLADGTTSLYFGTGGGMLGGGQHPVVAQAARTFVVTAEQFYRTLTLAEAFPLPNVGWITFTILTLAGAFTAHAIENELISRQHPLAPLYFIGQEVLTQLRLIQEA